MDGFRSTTSDQSGFLKRFRLDVIARSLVSIAAMVLLITGVVHGAVTFDELLEESSLSFKKPEGFVEVSPEINPVLLYETAYRREDEALEIRYAIRPLARAEVDYEDPHNAAPDPNHLFPLMFQKLIGDLAADRNMPTTEYSSEQATAQFNADWAAAAAFDVTRDFSADYRQALFLALHKNHHADAYVVFLYNEYAGVRQSIKTNMETLRFTP